VAGPDRAVAGLQHHLRPDTRGRIVGRVGLSVSAGAPEIHNAATAVARAAERRHEAEIVEQLRQAAARSASGGVLGVEEDLVRQALAQDATVHFARGTELDRYGRIGALTSY
jgi:hypothetical protein